MAVSRAVISRRGILLIARLMLLIDDDKAEIRQRGKHRRPRPDNDIRLTVPYPLPLRIALCAGQSRMHHRDPLKPRIESLNSLGRQCDFRQKHDRAFAFFDHRLNRTNVKFRLAAVGDAVQKRDAESVFCDLAVDMFECRLLLVVEDDFFWLRRPPPPVSRAAPSSSSAPLS